MNILSHPEIIGIDVSRDWLDLHCLSDGHQLQLPNTGEGHSELAKFAGDREALVCFEATGGHEWRLWASLEAAGIEARQLAPAQVKAFGRSRGTLAKTDRIDAELIACFMAFRPEAGRRLFRQIRELGYESSYAAVTAHLRAIRPDAAPRFERRFETGPGEQAQVDFAEFKTEYADEPGVFRKVHLFSFVLGCSRWLRDGSAPTRSSRPS